MYRFHKFITEKTDDLTVNNITQVVNKSNMPHMDIGFIDYRKFVTGDFNPVQQTQKVPIWERYIYGLLEGTLQGEEVSDEVREIPPEILASLLNKISDQPLKEETYEKVITTYMRSSSESIFSGQDLRDC